MIAANTTSRAETEIEVEVADAAELAEPKRHPMTISRYARTGIIAARKFPELFDGARWLVLLRRVHGVWRLVEIPVTR